MDQMIFNVKKNRHHSGRRDDEDYNFGVQVTEKSLP